MKSILLKIDNKALISIDSLNHIAEIVSEMLQSYSKVYVLSCPLKSLVDDLSSFLTILNFKGLKREEALLLSSASYMTVSLLSMIIQRGGLKAASFTGYEARIITTNDYMDAEILDFDFSYALKKFSEYRVIILDCSQGITVEGELTLLSSDEIPKVVSYTCELLEIDYLKTIIENSSTSEENRPSIDFKIRKSAQIP